MVHCLISEAVIYVVHNVCFECIKVGETRKMIAVAYGKRSGDVNLSVLEDLVNLLSLFPIKPFIINFKFPVIDECLPFLKSRVLTF